MSGGRFEYKQYNLSLIRDEIRHELEIQGTPRPNGELFSDPSYYEKYPEEKFYPKYSKEVDKAFLKAIFYLKVAEIYAQRIDWFLSGDDGEETFLQRLEDDLAELGKGIKAV